MRFTDEDVTLLTGFDSLEWIQIENATVTDIWLDKLQGVEGLRRLVLINTRVTADGVDRFRRARPCVHVLFLDDTPKGGP
jgi:hypothetical protein